MSRYPTRDWATEDGAHDLAARVERYWAEKGEIVRTHVSPAGDLRDGKNALIWCVRSDMINGLPRRGA